MEFGSEIHCSLNWAEPKVLIQVHILREVVSAVSERLQEKTGIFLSGLWSRESFIAVGSDNPDNPCLVSDSDDNNLLVLLQVSRLKQHNIYRKLSEIKPHVAPLPPDGDSCVTDRQSAAAASSTDDTRPAHSCSSCQHMIKVKLYTCMWTRLWQKWKLLVQTIKRLKNVDLTMLIWVQFMLAAEV